MPSITAPANLNACLIKPLDDHHPEQRGFTVDDNQALQRSSTSAFNTSRHTPTPASNGKHEPEPARRRGGQPD